MNEAERNALPYLRYGIVNYLSTFSAKYPDLQEYFSLLNEYPHPNNISDPPEPFLEQTKNILSILLEDPALSSTLHQASTSNNLLSPLFSEIISSYSQIFSSAYTLNDKELLFTKLIESTTSSDPFKISEEKYELVISDIPWLIHVTHLSALKTRSKKVLEQFDQIDGILFFVDVMDYENPQCIQLFGDFVNCNFMSMKPVILVGYNKSMVVDKGIEEETYFKKFLEVRSSAVQHLLVDFNRDQIENILRSIVQWKIPTGQ